MTEHVRPLVHQMFVWGSPESQMNRQLERPALAPPRLALPPNG